MTTAITTKAVSEMTAEEKAQEQDRIRLIQRTVAAGTTKDELLMFLYQAKKTGLDPLARQINIIIRGKGDNRKATIQASIDGLRLVAERSGKYAGQDAPEFEVLDSEMKATVRVYKFDPAGNRYCDSVGVAYMSEYKPAPPNDFMWKKMPHAMLAKVAEALALRKAFPQDLSGIYSEEEMAQADAAPIRKTIDPQMIDAPAEVETSAATDQPNPAPTTTEPAKKELEDIAASIPGPNDQPADDAKKDGEIIESWAKPPAQAPGIMKWQSQIEAATTNDQLTLIENNLTLSKPSPLLASTVKEMIQQRKQKLADQMFGK